MKRRTIPDSEFKLVILYALSRLGPVTNMQLLQFMVELDLMNYFDLQINLSVLEEQEQVVEQASPLGTLLAVGEKGLFTLTSFEHRIPASTKDCIDEQSTLWRNRFRNEQQTLAESFTLSDGRVCIRLRLLEASTTLLDLMLTLDSSSSVPKLEERWRAAAQATYDTVMSRLGADFDASRTPDPLPETAALEQVSDQEWLLSLADAMPQPRMTLMLSVPDQNLALHYAAKWQTCCAELRKAMLALMEIEG
jgi:hypothetical protein